VSKQNILRLQWRRRGDNIQTDRVSNGYKIQTEQSREGATVVLTFKSVCMRPMEWQNATAEMS